MKPVQEQFPIVKKDKLTDTVWDMTVSAPTMAAAAVPGQFVHIRCGEKTLRRPISICEINRESGTLRLVFEVRGEGTLWLSEQPQGAKIDILGPVGTGFPLTLGSRAVFVGGGIGVPPLLEAAKQFVGASDAILGFRGKAAAILEEDFRAYCTRVDLTTEDGSAGTEGFVTQILAERLKAGEYDRVYACGPTPMLKAVAALSQECGVACFVSLEERMGCGVGACLVCACKIQENGEETYRHVCKDGPVFPAEKVVWA